MHKQTRTAARRTTSKRFAVVALGLAFVTIAAISTARLWAQTPSQAVAQVNFDIRTDKDAATPAQLAYRERTVTASALSGSATEARVAGAARLQARVGALDVSLNNALGTTEIVGAVPGGGFLTGASNDHVAALRAFVAAYADLYGVNAAEVAALDVVADYTNPAGNMSWVELEQRINGLPVFQGRLRGGFTAKGELARTTGVLASGIVPSQLSSVPSLGAAQAVAAAAASVGWNVSESSLVQKSLEDNDTRVTFARGTMASDAKAWLLYFPIAPGIARLAWATEIWGAPDVFLTLVDAVDGTVLFRKNLTEYQTQSATYNVYTSDSPAPASPTPALPGANYQAPFVARVLQTLIGNEVPNTFNDLGWLTDGTNTTDGNNVEAGLDIDGVNGVDAPVSGTARTFNFTYDPQTDAPATAAYRDGDVTNMFYWVNRYHDATYRLGFTEVGGNFQNSNFGRGGVAGDRVSAETQDSSGTNNANFATPADGGRGRMQMYLFTGPTPVRSGGLDQDIVLHELTHGLSNRLHGNASGLSTNMARGMGEGWSDFYARSLLATADEDASGIYTTGGWATQLLTAGYTDNYYYGIRRFPMAVRARTGSNSKPHNPLTFADVDATQFDISDGAYPRGPIGSATVDQVHNMGEVWSNTLFEVRARLIARLGFAVGNDRMLQLVTDGMKLDPLAPTMIQARDAIIAAANASGTPADVADIWAGFATRGMGVLALVTDIGSGNNDTRVAESFLIPGDPFPSFSIGTVSVAEGNSGTANATFTVTLANPSSSTSRVRYITADGTASSTPVTLSSVGAITVPAGAPGTSVGPSEPYPSSLLVAGVAGTIQSLSVRLNSLSHTYPADIDALLVGPGGQRVMLMSDTGGTSAVTGVDITFRDGAPPLSTTAATTGTYAPTDTRPGETMPGPAPAGPHGASLATFNGSDPNGTWSLYVADDEAGDVGAIGSFSLLISTAAAGSDYGPVGGELAFAPGTTTRTIAVPVNGDATVEANETFVVNLSNPQNAVLGVAQGVGTIFNDDGAVTAPTGNDDVYATPAGTPLIVVAPGVLTNDFSNGGGTLSAAVFSNPANGSLALAASGGFTYTPNAGFAGVDSFMYRVSNLVAAGNLATVTLQVTAPPVITVQPATGFVADSIIGNVVRFRWTPPSTGPSPTSYVLEGGLLPAQVLASLPTGSASPVFTVSVPTGSFYVRVHSIAGAGRSAASNEIRVHVNTPVPPSAPTNLLGTVNGSNVALAWKNTFGGGAATGLVIDVTGSLSTSLPIGLSESFAFGGVPGGTYTLSLRATNGAGVSPSSNPVTLTFPGACSGAPAVPANLLPYKIGNTVYVIWDPPTSGPAPTTYVLNVTGAFVTSVATTGRSVSSPVPPGTYNFTVAATNACGSSAPTAVQSVTVP